MNWIELVAFACVLTNTVLVVASEEDSTSSSLVASGSYEQTTGVNEKSLQGESFDKLASVQKEWILDYLLKYGYLDFEFVEKTPQKAALLRSDAPPQASAAPQRLYDIRKNSEQIEKALAYFQSFSGLESTGKIDFSTRQQLVARRCGVRDIDSEFSVTGNDSSKRTRRYAVSPNIRWKRKQLSYRFINYSASLGEDTTRKLVVRALKQWAKAGDLRIEESKIAAADITFLFAKKNHGDAYRFDGPGAVLAHAFFPGETLGGEVHFDDDEPWFDTDQVADVGDGVDMYAVALHEIGHALGLGHSSASKSVMNPWYNNYAADPKLGDDDLFALKFLYGSASLEETDSTSIPTTAGNDTRHERIPDVCDTDFDAMSMIGDQIYAFRRGMLWKFDNHGTLSTGFPMLASDYFMGLPTHVQRVDAFFQRKVDNDVIIFSGDRYWRFRSYSIIPGFPPNGRPILELGLPPDVEKIDAVFIWSGNKQTYLVSGDRYWKLDEERNHVAYTYPRPVERFWRGIPLPLNSAFLNSDGVTYFVVETFSGGSNNASQRRFIPFDDYMLQAAKARPLETTKLWTACLELNTSLEETRALTAAVSTAPGRLIESFEILLVSLALTILLRFKGGAPVALAY